LAELRAHLVKGTIPLPGPILQFLSPADKKQGAQIREGADAEETRGDHNTKRTIAYLEDAPRRTAVDPQSLVLRPVERGTVVAEFLPQLLLGLSIDEVGRWRDGTFLLLLRARRGAIRSREDRV
jgi:hypothetical protein